MDEFNDKFNTSFLDLQQAMNEAKQCAVQSGVAENGTKEVMTGPCWEQFQSLMTAAYQMLGVLF